MPDFIPHESWVVVDPTDFRSWGPAVYRAAEKIAASTWGETDWYLRVANGALTAALELDPKDTQRVFDYWAGLGTEFPQLGSCYRQRHEDARACGMYRDHEGPCSWEQ